MPYRPATPLHCFGFRNRIHLLSLFTRQGLYWNGLDTVDFYPMTAYARTAVLRIILPVLVLWPMPGMTEDVRSRPFWTEQAVFHFGDDVFFTGRASCAPSVEEGRRRAHVAAVQEIKNFSHVGEINGFVLDTQMVFEEFHSADCPVGSVTAWRLLRVPRAVLESLARRSEKRVPEDISPIVAQTRAIRNMTPHIGMVREDIWHRYGQPRSVWMNPETGEAFWEYPQFGLTLVFDHEDLLKQWRLTSPGLHQESGGRGGRAADEGMPHPALQLPAIDLTGRLRELEENQDRYLRQQAQLYCAIRFPGRQQDMTIELQMHCEQREYERQKYPQRQH